MMTTALRSSSAEDLYVLALRRHSGAGQPSGQPSDAGVIPCCCQETEKAFAVGRLPERNRPTGAGCAFAFVKRQPASSRSIGPVAATSMPDKQTSQVVYFSTEIALEEGIALVTSTTSLAFLCASARASSSLPLVFASACELFSRCLCASLFLPRRNRVQTQHRADQEEPDNADNTIQSNSTSDSNQNILRPNPSQLPQ